MFTARESPPKDGTELLTPRYTKHEETYLAPDVHEHIVPGNCQDIPYSQIGIGSENYWEEVRGVTTSQARPLENARSSYDRAGSHDNIQIYRPTGSTTVTETRLSQTSKLPKSGF